MPDGITQLLAACATLPTATETCPEPDLRRLHDALVQAVFVVEQRYEQRFPEAWDAHAREVYGPDASWLPAALDALKRS